MTSQNKYVIDTIEKYSDMVYKVALTRVKTKENAEDIYQDVFLKFNSKRPKFKTEEHKKAWLIRVTINLSNNFLKSAWKRKNVELDENIKYEDEKIDDIENGEVLEEVKKLPEDYQTVIYLYYYEGYKVEEISKILSKKSGTIKTWLSRAREILKQNLKGGFEDE